MKRGDIVEYLFPALADSADADTIKRAKPVLVTRLALVRSIAATRADILVLDAESWESPRLVSSVLLDDGTHTTANRNQCDDRATAIEAGTLDSMRDTVKGWVRALTP